MRKKPLDAYKNINGDRAIAAMIYYNESMSIFSPQDQKIITDPDFYTVMSSTTSLEEGIARLHDKRIKSRLPTDLQSLILGFITPEEAYVRNVMSSPPSPALLKASKGITAQKALEAAAAKGWFDSVKALVENKGVECFDLENALYFAAEGGHIPVMELLVSKGAINLNYALYEASSGGHIPAMEWLEAKGADSWEYSLLLAARGGHIPAMEWLARKGAKIWKYALGGAVKGGSISAIEWLMAPARGIILTQPDLEAHLMEAAESGHVNVARWLVDRGAINFYQAFIKAAKNGHIEVMEYLIRGREHILDQGSYIAAIAVAAQEGHIPVIEWLEPRVTPGNMSWSYVLNNAARGGHITVMKYVVDKGVPVITLNAALLEAVIGGHVHAVVWLVEQGANNLRVALEEAIFYNQRDVIEFLSKRM